MHAGKVETSDRLRKTLECLRRAGARGATTLQIEQETDSRAVHSDIAGLRENGIRIHCDRKRPARYWLEELMQPPDLFLHAAAVGWLLLLIPWWL